MTNQETQIRYIIIYPLPSKVALFSGSFASIFIALIGIILELSLYTILFRAVVAYLLFLGIGWVVGYFIEDIIKTLEKNKGQESIHQDLVNNGVNLPATDSSFNKFANNNLITDEQSLLKEPLDTLNFDNLTSDLNSIKI